MFQRKFVFIFSLVLLCSCGKEQQENSLLSENIDLSWKLVTNNYLEKGVHQSILTITNNSKNEMGKDWELFFNYTFCRKVFADSCGDKVKLTHINGDFYKLAPTEKYIPLKPGESLEVPIVAGFVAIKNTDAPGGFYFVFKNEKKEELQPEKVDIAILPFDEKELKRNPNDKIPVLTAEEIYRENQKLSLIPEEDVPLIIPTPLSLKKTGDSLVLNREFVIHYQEGLENEGRYLHESLKNDVKLKLLAQEGLHEDEAIIQLKLGKLNFSVSPEAYALKVTNNNIVIEGNSPAGVFYGIQSLRALLPINAYAVQKGSLVIPQVEVQDAPSFAFRSIMIDIARNFQPKQNLLKWIDLLSFYKINKLTLHLADDEGWRLEIKDLPELTEIGSRREHPGKKEKFLLPSYGSGPDSSGAPGSGYYSRGDFIDILTYARQRHIEVIPEIDLPGHARAAIHSMDARYNRLMKEGKKEEAEKYLLRDLKDQSEYYSVQLYKDNVVCPCQEGVYNFLEAVTKEIKEIYKEASAPLSTIHIGGDEVPEGVWVKSPVCQEFMAKSNDVKNINQLKDYFFSRAVGILQAHNLIASGYEDVAIHRVKNEKNESVVEIRKMLPPSYTRLISWCNVWGWGGEDYAYRLANEGYPVVLGHVTNLYLDLAYTKNPEDPGQYWGGLNDTRKGYEYLPMNFYNSHYFDIDGNPIDLSKGHDKVKLTAKGRSNIIGIQGLLFSEVLKSPQMVEYFLFPKMIGMAERAWAKEPSWANIANREKRLEALEKDWNVFANAIGRRELPRLDYLAGGVNYHLPFPGAVRENGVLKVNTSWPGLKVVYSSDGSEPNASSLPYKEEVEVKGPVKLATVSRKGRISKIISNQ